MAISEADLDQRIRAALTQSQFGATYPDIVQSLADIDRPRLEARLHYLQSTGQVQQLGGIWSAVVTERELPPEPDHRRIPSSCFIARQHTSELASGSSLPPRRSRITERPAIEAEPPEPILPAEQIIEDPPMAKMKTCRSCGTKKMLDEFDKANRSPDNHTSDCHQCRQPADVPAPPKSIAEVAKKHTHRVNGSPGFQSAIDALRSERGAAELRIAKIDQALAALEQLQ